MSISEDQVYDGCSFIGESYKKYIELFNRAYEQHYKRNFDNVFFDCTNYYFEIEDEDGIKGKRRGAMRVRGVGIAIAAAWSSLMRR